MHPGAAKTFRQMTTLAAVRRAALRSLIPPPRLALSDWIERELRLPADVSALPGPVRLYAYQRGIADAISDPAIERVTLEHPFLGYTWATPKTSGPGRFSWPRRTNRERSRLCPGRVLGQAPAPGTASFAVCDARKTVANHRLSKEPQLRRAGRRAPGHFHRTLSGGAYVPARIAGMSEDQPRPDLDVRYWAEIDLTEGVELSPLRERHLKG